MIQLGIICPVPHLNDFATQSSFHLILPHLFDKFPEYEEFYRQRSSAGDFVLMDSSIFELDVSLPGQMLLELAERVQAKEMTVPEVLRDSDKSKKYLEEFLSLYAKSGSKISLLAVVQGESLPEMIQYYNYLETVSEISTIGLPFDLDWNEQEFSGIRSRTLRRVLNRWELVDRISHTARKPIHLMGLSDAVELQRYVSDRYSRIRSNDSSSAFVHGAAGILYTDRGLPCEKISTKLDFSMKLSTETQKESVLFNIQQIKKFAGHYESTSQPSR